MTALLLASMLALTNPAEIYEVPAEVLEVVYEDVDLLARIIYHEAGNQDETGKRLVGSVVLNRIDDPRFPSTISEVVFQPGQFTTASELYSVTPTEECYEAARAELAERTNTEVLYFNCNRQVYGEYLFQWGDQHFAR